MRDNLVFAGTSEHPEKDPEKVVKNFIWKQLKLPEDTVSTIEFHWGKKKKRIPLGPPTWREASRQSPPMCDHCKFEHFKQKELVKSWVWELHGTDFNANDQFLKEILNRRRQLIPLRIKFLEAGSQGGIAVIRQQSNHINGPTTSTVSNTTTKR